MEEKFRNLLEDDSVLRWMEAASEDEVMPVLRERGIVLSMDEYREILQDTLKSRSEELGDQELETIAAGSDTCRMFVKSGSKGVF